MNYNTSYIAITTGPIYRASDGIKSTKGLWASSYFFSYLAKKLIEPFKDRTFIIPLVNDPELWHFSNGIGRFPDRFIFEAQENDLDCLKKQVKILVEDIGNNIAECLEENPKDVVVYLRNFLKIYFFEKSCNPNQVIEECNALLDLMEMQDTYNLYEPESYLHDFFEHPNLYQSFLFKDAFKERNTFESLEDISTAEIEDAGFTALKEELRAIEAKIHQLGKTKKAEEKQQELLQLQQEKEKINLKIKNLLYPYQNYIAIITADGDHMSKTIKALVQSALQKDYTEHPVNELNKRMIQFGNKAIEIVGKRGARIIFLGGDDLLLFAPVQYKGETVFHLVYELSETFDRIMDHLEEKPSLSFGISITYTKYPMGEALQMANQLLKKAKGIPQKNRVAFTLQKHSGQCSGAVLSKSTKGNIFKQFIDLLNSYANGQEKLLTSIIFFLGNHENILSTLLCSGSAKEQEERLVNYFENSLNETPHQELKPFFKTLQNLIINTKENTLCNLDKEKGDLNLKAAAVEALQTVQSLLRFIHFIKSERHAKM